MDYLFWLIVIVWIPALILWALLQRPKNRDLKAAGRLVLLVLVTHLPIEYVILRYPMVMGEGHYLGVRLLSYPIEDFLFFATMPFLVYALASIADRVSRTKC